ncbi:hypothetical protein [Nocardia mangyaensis]|uniref:hypothetical protein n=1 Tax=Nocardia mangyaensis TaxID=2213200 RepID=UPI002675EC7A|nr:hypothetical protein [Nocardia mangyaensis]MDO3648221.1 hypothetical protein [Nocardia mangyaensis]
MAPEQRSAHWDEIVGGNWPAIGPAEWSALETVAREASRAMDVGDAAQARLGFDERVRSSGRLQSVKDRMLAQQNDPQAYSDALAATAAVLRSYSDVAYRTRNQILDIVERADRDIRAEHRAAAAEAEDEATADEDRESAADRAAARAHRIAAVITRARADVDDVAAAALNSISPVSLPELTAVADHLGQPGPLAPNRPAAPNRSAVPPPPVEAPGPEPAADATPAPDAAGSPDEERNPYARAPRAAFPLQLAGGTPDSAEPVDDDAHAEHVVPERRGSSVSAEEAAVGPPPALSAPGEPPGGRWHEPSAEAGTGGASGTGIGRGAPVAAGSEPDDDETSSDTEASTVDGLDPSSDGDDRVESHSDGGDEDRAGAGAADRNAVGDESAVDSDLTPGSGSQPTGAPPVPGQVLAPVVAAPPPIPMVAPPPAAGAGAAASSAGPAHQSGTAARSGSGVFAPNSSGPPGTPAGGPPNRADARPDRSATPPTRNDATADPAEPRRAEEVVGAAMVAAAAPSFLLGERVDGDLILARTLLAGVLAAIGPTVLGLDVAVATLRGPGGLSAFLTSNEGRGWLPSGLYLPEAVSMPWLWAEAEHAGAAWEGLADPARVLVEFGLAWGRRSGARLTALASSRTIGLDLRARWRELPMADSVQASAQWDLRSRASGSVDRLGLAGARELSVRADRIPRNEVPARCAGLAWDAHTKVAGTTAPGPEAVLARAVREGILAAVRRAESVSPDLWDELRDADDLLTAAMLPRRADASRVDLGELKPDPERAVLRAMVFERRCDELVLLLAQPGDAGAAAQLMRDVVYAHAQVIGHPQFIPPAPAGSDDPAGRPPTITAPRG